MNIKSKYEINELVKHKFSYDEHSITALEIMEVSTVTCYAGTQIFYNCRPIIAKRHKDNPEKWEVFYAVHRGEDAYDRLREDELSFLDEESKSIILKSYNA